MPPWPYGLEHQQTKLGLRTHGLAIPNAVLSATSSTYLRISDTTQALPYSFGITGMLKMPKMPCNLANPP